jgi:hypothetical protein
VELIAADPSVAAWPPAREALAHFSAADLRDAGTQLVATWGAQRPVGEVIDQLPPALKQLVSAAVMAGAMGSEERRRAAEDCVRRINLRTARAQRQAIAAEVRGAESRGDETWRAKLVDLNELRRKEGGAG